MVPNCEFGGSAGNDSDGEHFSAVGFATECNDVGVSLGRNFLDLVVRVFHRLVPVIVVDLESVLVPYSVDGNLSASLLWYFPSMIHDSVF